MVEAIRVFMQVKDIFDCPVKEALEEYGKEAFCKEIYQSAQGALENNFPGAIDCTVDFDSADVKDWILGAENTSPILETAKRWNSEVLEEVKLALAPLEEIKENMGYSDIYSVIEHCEKKKKKTDFDYEYSLYRLRVTLSALSNHLAYACPTGIVITDTNYGHEFHTKMDKETLELINEHPKEFVIFWLYYA